MTIVQDKTGLTITLKGKPNVNKIKAYLELMRQESVISESTVVVRQNEHVTKNMLTRKNKQ